MSNDDALRSLVALYGVDGLLSRGVLLVDDEPANIDVLREFLDGDYTVYLATSGEEALRLAESVELDVVITDQRMPEMTGVQLLERLQISKPDVAGIVLTAYTDTPALLSAINRARAFRFLRKPWEPAEVLDAVAQASEHVYQRRAIERLLELLSKRNRDLSHRTDELAKALEALRGAQSQMLHMERLSTTGRLAAGLAHDLRNVMTPFLYLENELSRGGLSNAVLESVHVGVGGFRNLLATLETLRHFDRGGERMDVKLDRLDPAAVVRDAVAIARMDMGYRERRVEVRIGERLTEIAGDRQKLVQVLINLVRNAVQATAPGQGVAIEVSQPGPGQNVFAVEDEGPGVPTALRDRLFAPFVSGRGEQGMGMGLYMARLIVEGHRGTIRCADRSGGGARFEVCLATALPAQARLPA
jgi:signal transduction histidine kinase